MACCQKGETCITGNAPLTTPMNSTPSAAPSTEPTPPPMLTPPITQADREHLIAQICHGSVSYKDIKDKPVRPVLKQWLNPSQVGLIDKYAPERIEMPSDRRAKITYVADGQPFLSARIQDLYGLKETPRIAMSRVPLLIHILAPSNRPVQITQDLAGFWRDHYPRVK